MTAPIRKKGALAQGITCADCPELIPYPRANQRRCRNCARLKENAAQRARYAANREAVLAYHRGRNYGLTDTELVAILEKQKGLCPICLEPLPWPDPGSRADRQQRLAVDHCHDTNRVRGLLHGLCNSGIGQLKDDPDRCERAAAYLRAALESA